MKRSYLIFCLALVLLATLCKAQVDFEEKVHQALMKKLAREGIKVEEAQLPLLRATVDELIKMLTQRGMEPLVMAKLNVNQRQK